MYMEKKKKKKSKQNDLHSLKSVLNVTYVLFFEVFGEDSCSVLLNNILVFYSWPLTALLGVL